MCNVSLEGKAAEQLRTVATLRNESIEAAMTHILDCYTRASKIGGCLNRLDFLNRVEVAAYAVADAGRKLKIVCEDARDMVEEAKKHDSSA